jgi:hypothetical protein
MLHPPLSEDKPLAIDYAGETLHLLPEHALWWPAQGVLWIADLHLGKAATYRALGQPVPAGTTQENLARLSRLLLACRPARLVFLGDFLHAAQARTPSVLAALAQWRSEHAAQPCVLVRGNHTCGGGRAPAPCGYPARAGARPFATAVLLCRRAADDPAGVRGIHGRLECSASGGTAALPGGRPGSVAFARKLGHGAFMQIYKVKLASSP